MRAFRANWVARVRPRPSKTVLGIILSAYGLYAVVQWSRAVHSPWHLFAPSVVRTVKWWPVAPPWLSVLNDHLHTAAYLVCCTALLIGGVSVACGHRLSTRIVTVALATLIGLWLIGLPFDIGLACGWLTLDYSKINATDLAKAVHMPPEALRHLQPEPIRLGASLGLISSTFGMLVIAAALVWLRREVARDASADDDASGQLGDRSGE